MASQQAVKKVVRWRVAVILVSLATMLSLGQPRVLLAQRRGPSAGATPGAGQMRYYKTMYYDLYTDLDKDAVIEAAYRMTAMGVEYSKRMRDFRGKVTRRMPFYLFSRKEDYYAAGGMPGSAGVYMGRTLVESSSEGTRRTHLGGKLMAVMIKGRESHVWHTIRHEGFHQFVAMAMQRPIPPWVNEGLAEYFGEGIWTGDGFVVGMVENERLGRIKAQIKSGRMLKLADLLNMNGETWNAQMSGRNYDQAWSLIHFLIHGEDHKYHRAFANFLSDLGAGRQWEAAFVNRFGRDVSKMQKGYNEWWMSLPQDATQDVLASATVQTLTSFLARAVAKRQKIKDFDDFRAKAAAGKLLSRPEQYLPPSLLVEALKASAGYKGWELKRVGPYPAVVLTDPKGNVYTGTFRVSRGLAKDVAIKVKQAPKSRSKPTPKPK